MRFTSEVEGPLDIGAMMVAFVEVYNKDGNLFNPPDGQVRVQTEAGDFLTFLHPGDKGIGKCEFAPLMGRRAKYMFRMESTAGDIWSDWAVCDLALPFVGTSEGGQPSDRPGEVGQLHKSFYVRFREQDGEQPPTPPTPPTPPEECARCAEFEAQRTKVQDALEALEQAVKDLMEI